jgi:hypothetical protein
MNARSLLRRDIPVATAVPYFLLILLLPLSLLQMRITARWVGDVISASSTMTVAQLRIAASSDFRTFWTSGELVRQGKATLDYQPTRSGQTRHVANVRANRWIYPPPTMLITPLASFGGFVAGFAVWTLCLTGLAVILLRSVGMPWVPLIASLFAPATLWNLNLGQPGLVTGAGFLTAAIILDRHPHRAAAFLGSLMIKPQAALLAPIMVLARRQYRAFFIAGAVVLGIGLLATWVLGWPIWIAFFKSGTSTERAILFAPFPTRGQYWGASVFWMLRSFGLSVALSMAGQVTSGIAAMIWCWRLWRADAPDPVARAALTVMLTLLLTPYAYTDDMCGYTLAIAWLAWRRHRLAMADVILLMWPGFCSFVSFFLKVEITPIFVVWAAYRAGQAPTIPMSKQLALTK